MQRNSSTISIQNEAEAMPHFRSTRAKQHSRLLKTAIYSVAALTFSGLLSACGTTPSASKSSPTASTKSPYTIGVIADLTGSDASFGTDILKGVQGGFKIVNDAGGIDGHLVKLVNCDTQSSTAGAVNCGNKLASGNSLVITAANIGYLKASLPALSKKLVLVNSPLLNPPYTSNAFQVGPAISAIPGEMLKAARNSNLTKIGVVATNDATGMVQVKYMKANAGSLTIVPEFIPTGATDVTAEVESLEAAHVQAIYVAALGTAAAATVEAYHQLGANLPLVVTGGDVNKIFLTSITSYEPKTNFFGIPDEAATVPGELPSPFESRDNTYFEQFKKVEGSSPDATIVAAQYTVSTAVSILKHLGPNASLSKMESYLHSAVVHSLTDISFSNHALNVATGVSPGIVRIVGGQIEAFHGTL